jgi:hypothetical protein
MGEQRVIAEVRGYDEFTAALRGWIRECGTTYECINEIAGLPGNYLAKMISATPVRSFSRVSLGATLGALGVKLLLVVDHEKLAAMVPRFEPRKKDTSERIRAPRRSPLQGNSELAAFYARRRATLQSPQRRRALARKAIRIRWQRAKAAPENAPVR